MEEINKKYAEINELNAFLDKYDYKGHKEIETSYAMSETLKQERQSARNRINQLESEIADLELLQQEYLSAIDDIEL